MMKNVQAFIDRINERNHILLLLENTELEVCFVTNEQAITLLIHDGKLCLIKELNKTNNIIEIYGEPAALQKLLEGRETLRGLIKKGQLQVSATFRMLLLLESCFYLGKGYVQTHC